MVNCTPEDEGQPPLSITLPSNYTPATILPETNMISFVISNAWDAAKTAGSFRYNLDESVQSKVVPGDHGFVVNVNPFRVSKRRPPQTVNEIKQPFNEEGFHFNKLKKSEILYKIDISSDTESSHIGLGSDYSSIIAINDSPICDDHVLIIPNPQENLPQILTLYSLQLGLSYLSACSSPDTRVAFNSLCAHASVNHLHLHAWRYPYSLPVESLSTTPITPNCNVTTDYPAKAFMLELLTDTTALAKDCFEVVSVLQEEGIPHNIMMTYADPTVSPPDTAPSATIRVYIWPVKSSNDLPESSLFKPGVCEISGHIIIDSSSLYQTLTEQDIIETLQTTNLSSSQFDMLVEVIKTKLSYLS